MVETILNLVNRVIDLRCDARGAHVVDIVEQTTGEKRSPTKEEKQIETTFIVDGLSDAQVNMVLWEGLRRHANAYLRHISGTASDRATNPRSVESMNEWNTLMNMERVEFTFDAAKHIGIPVTAESKSIAQKMQTAREGYAMLAKNGTITEEQVEDFLAQFHMELTTTKTTEI